MCAIFIGFQVDRLLATEPETMSLSTLSTQVSDKEQTTPYYHDTSIDLFHPHDTVSSAPSAFSAFSFLCCIATRPLAWVGGVALMQTLWRRTGPDASRWVVLVVVVLVVAAVAVLVVMEAVMVRVGIEGCRG